MAIEIGDISLSRFLEKCTYQSDPTPGQKLVLTNGDFVIAAALLKLDIQIQRIIGKLGNG